LPEQSESSVEIGATPFHPQQAYQCGPAALATALGAAGVKVTPGELQKFVFIPDRRGSLQAEIVSTARRFGRIPYRIDATFPALIEQLNAGRPVLVLQNLGVSFAPAWHYAVVIGYSGPRREIILRSGTTERLVQAARTFVRTWRRSDYWGIVLLRPEDIPPTVDEHRYLETVAAAETAGQLDLAIPAFRSALLRWPQNPVPYLGLGNSTYQKGDFALAEYWYRQLLDLNPGDPLGSNNLASLLAELGRCAEARELIEGALQTEDENSPYWQVLSRTDAVVSRCR
jgi:tetratricopeptide (TPR) repeat protein